MSWSSPMCMCCMSCCWAGSSAGGVGGSCRCCGAGDADCAAARFAVTLQVENANAPMRTDEKTRADIHPCSPRLNRENDLSVGDEGLNAERDCERDFQTT